MEQPNKSAHATARGWRLSRRMASTFCEEVVRPAFGYSGDDLSGTLGVRQIAKAIFMHAHEHGGTVSVPYEEIPQVQWAIRDFFEGNRGTLILANHEDYSHSPERIVPVAVFTLGTMVAVGYSDGSAHYHGRSARPPWVALREGPTAWEYFTVLSPLLSLFLILVVVKLWLSQRRTRAEQIGRGNE